MMTSFTVADVKRSIAFYRDKLGFRIRECWPDENRPLFAGLLFDQQAVLFSQAMPAAEVEKMHEKNPTAGKFWSKQAAAFADGRHGAGVNTYLMVADIDAYAAQLKQRGVTPELPPTTQFYGLRDLVVVDPDGYLLTFYTPIAMANCQSCGMPLTDSKPGQMYCQYCVDEKGALRPYEQVFEGTVNGYFIAHMKMARKDAEKAATVHLAKMPAWGARK
jgi:catechol 2,3-dioxygenase-like lactoylglutathione lyase family enzyme